jgi:transcriptional regulator with XRE-family HTH domain
MTAKAERPQYGPWEGMDDAALSNALPRVGEYPAAGLVRRARRLADLSQRQMARLAGVAPSTIGKVESGRMSPSLELFQRLIGTAELCLVVIDRDRRLVLPMGESADTRDGAERRYPSHLDTILDPRPGEWWADGFGLARPPETFHRNRHTRDVLRQRSREQLRAAQQKDRRRWV